MEDLSKFRPVVFEKGFYTIKEAIDKISGTFKIPIHGSKNKTRYKTVYQRLWRELGAMELTEGKDIMRDSKRKTKYSHTILSAVINQGLYSWLCEMAKDSEYQEFTQWKNRAKNYGRKYEEIMATADQIDTMEQSSDFSVADAVEAEVQKRKLQIALDFIFSHCIKLDEILLRTDIANDFCLDEAAPSAYDLIANERLMNLKNYYKIRKNE